MKQVTLFNKDFTKKEDLAIPFELNNDSISTPAVHQVVVSLLARRRQGNACTKNKALVQGGGAKPFKQKGTGRARQGSTRSPLMPGGGTVFGPTPRSYYKKVNKKVMNLAVKSILADKLNAGKLFVFESFDFTGKTKDMAAFLGERNLESTLLVCESKDNPGIRGIKNLRKCRGLGVEGFSVYEAVKYENLLIDQKSFNKLIERLG
ncbi:50S ribosomal protein L4 [Bacteriovoracaceae bacterium]|nr:50S ribosomal protein L4 [Bacteriovoracaceae bacterium]